VATIQRHLHAEVAAGDHDGVEGVDDLFEVVDRLRLLHLGDDRQAHAELVHDRVYVFDVARAAHEGQGDHVGAHAGLVLAQRPAQVGHVLVGQRRHGDRDAGQVDALVVGDLAAFDGHALDPRAVHRDHFEGHPAVVDQDAVARGAVPRQPLVRGGADLPGARHVFSGDGEPVAARQHVRAVREAAQADLRALQVHQDAHGPPGVVGGLAQVEIPGLVFGVRTVGQVQPADVEPCGDQCRELLGCLGRRAEGTDDFRATHESDLISYLLVTCPIAGWMDAFTECAHPQG
jgi:hypothetical protein